MIERAIAAACAVPEAPPAADVPVRQVQPQILRVAALLANPVLRVGADLPRGGELHQLLVILGVLDVLVLVVSLRGLHERSALVGDDGVADAHHDHGQVRARQRYNVPGASCVDDQQRMLLDGIPFVLHQRIEGRRFAFGLLLLFPVEFLEEVEAAAAAVALDITVDHVGAESIPRLQVDAQARRGQRRVERVNALVLINLVEVLGSLQPGRKGAGLLDRRRHRHALNELGRPNQGIRRAAGAGGGQGRRRAWP
mmetsp:Transcript_100700/g.307808  ORF Transcript_100700/g.307808 Transcript_100700/m.307808 type:complete len:254 (+) Transcript_100700:1546-2307(+)